MEETYAFFLSKKMKKGLLVLFCLVFIIVVLHGIFRRCTRVDVTVTQVTDTIYISNEADTARKAAYYRSKKPSILEINGADSIALIKIYGIGPVFASRIIKHREVLGGFAEIGQLKEVKGITNEVFESIYKNFTVDSSKIQKININFATRKQLEAHPYITPSMAHRIEQGRMKGGFFTSLQDILNNNILLPQEAQKVAPYLSFRN